MDDNVNARSDDLLALQDMGNQLEHDLSGKVEAMSSLNSKQEISISKSKTFTNCLLVRAETSASRFQERRREMAEIKHFLKQDWRFKGFVQSLERVDPGQERDEWYARFIRDFYSYRYNKDAEIMIDRRAYQACVYIALHDEDCADIKGLSDEFEELRRDRKSSFIDPVRGRVHTSMYPYNLGQCESTSGPNHVEDGGGAVAQRSSQDMDRTSLEQSQAFPRRDGPSQY
jgi:hypothetical protein